MSQNSTDWILVLWGSAGSLAVLGLTYFFNAQKKEKEVLEKINEDLRQKFEQVNQEKDKIQDQLTTVLENVSDTNELAKIQQIIQDLNTLGNQDKEFEDCRQAADWLKQRHSDWMTEATTFALKEYPNIVPRNKRKEFKKHIGEFLNWTFTCLSFYGHWNVPLKDYVENPSKQFSVTYIAAIEYIINNQESWGVLTPKQIKYLKQFLRELIEKIRYEL